MAQQPPPNAVHPDPGDNFLLLVSPLTRIASLTGELNRNFLQMCALTGNLAFNEISARQRESMRTMTSVALLSCWPQFYLAHSLEMAELRRTWGELLIKGPFTLTRMLSKTLANAGLEMSISSGRRGTIDPGRRVGAVVIDFPDRRKA